MTQAPQHDPLNGTPHPESKMHPHLYAAEFLGTALLVGVGLSIVIMLWGDGSPFAALPLQPWARRLLNGALFGGTGAVIAYSALGRISGAHINPAMTLAFWIEGKIKWRDALGYVVAQLAGAAVGGATLLLWGTIGASTTYGASLPEAHVPIYWPVAGELLCTYLLVLIVFVMVANARMRPYTPLSNPVLFAILVWLEAPLSGASANPARSFGPALVSGAWQDFWVYIAGPCLGAALAVATLRAERLRHHRPLEARLSHFRHPARTP
jgi:aquaporin Z